MKKVFVETLGCQMNKSDSERILGMLSHFDFEETKRAEEADFLIINTCSIRQLSADKAYSRVGVWGKWKQKNRGLKIAFCGCVAQQDKDKLLKRFPYLDLVFGTHNIYQLPELVKRIYSGERVCAVTNKPYITDETRYTIKRADSLNAWIPITEGCDNFCTYCIVPFTRGRERSRDPEKIIKEAETAIQQGFREITLLGQNVDSYSGKIDAVLPWGKNQLNVGSHFSYTCNSRQLDYETALLPDKQSDHFDYKEYVWALYAEYRRKFSDIWSMNLGVRMESTWTKGENRTVNEVHDDSYVRLFPSFLLGYNPNRRHSLNFSIINQVTRPNVNNVNPNVMQRDRYDIIVGNPYLKPSYLYKGNIGYTYNGLLSFDLFYAYQPDEMSNVVSIDGDMVRTTRWENCVDAHTLGVNSFYFFNKINWLSLTFMQGLYFSKTLSSSTYTLPEEKAFNYMAVVNMQFYFDAKRRFIGTLSGNFSSRQKTVKSDIKPLYRVDVALQYNCLNNKLNIGLMCRNLIASKIRGREYANGAIMDFNNKFQYIMPRLSITYNWGARLRAKRHDFESEKMNRRVVNDF